MMLKFNHHPRVPGRKGQLLLLGLCLAFSTHTMGQNQVVNLQKTTNSVQSLITAIEKQTSLSVDYRQSTLNLDRKVKTASRSENLSSLLSQMLKDTDLEYTLSGRHIIITPKQGRAKAPQQAGVPQKVKGQVVDAKGEPLVGVTVKVKGTTQAAITDMNGNYTIDARRGDTLEFSYVGFTNKEIKANGGKGNVTLSESAETLDQVIVIGYGTVRKADLAGSVGVMDGKKFSDQPITRISDAFQGRISGVQVANSGVPGGTIKIRVRGAGSVNRSNDPLYVIDGIARESGLQGINPEDVQSVQILKDASATAIYGSRGSNGVVLITTKSGHEGRTQVSFDAQIGVSNVAKRYKTLSPYEFATAYNEVHANTFDEASLNDFKNGTKGTDWQDAMFQTGTTRDYKVALSSGNATNQYYVSANYMGQTGAVIETKNERYQARVNLSSDITPWLNIKTDINASHTKTKNFNFGASTENVLWNMLNFSPVTDIRDANGNYVKRDYYCALTSDNPVAMMKENEGQTRHDIFTGHVDLRFNIMKGLTFTTTNGVDYMDTKYYNFTSKKVGDSNGMSNRDGQRMTLQTTNNLTYNGSWGQHSLTATGVFEATRSKYRYMYLAGDNLLTESVKWWNVGLARSRNQDNGYSSWTLLSWVGRVMYNYADRYLVTGTFRADGSSKFFNNKWGYFPSLAVAWSLGNEEFMKRQNVIQDAKVRVSYGLVGSQAIDPYETLGLMRQTGYAFGGTSKYTGFWSGTSVATPDLTWEKTHQFNVGLDFAMLNRSLRFSFDFFKKLTKDGLLKKSMPNYDGGGTYWVNAAEVSNQGLEFSIDANVVNRSSFNWSSTLTGTYLKNEVTSLDNIPYVTGYTPASGLTDAVTRIVKGKPIGSFYLYKWTGLDKDGHDTYADLDNSGTVSEGDRSIIGNANPDFTLGWNNHLTYKNWELNVFFTGAFGAQRLNLMRYSGASMNGKSTFVTLKEAYYESFGKSAHPRYPALNVTGNNYQAASTKWLEDADYLRLDNITLAYNLSKNITKFADLRISLSCQNLFTLTGYKGMDPAGLSFMDSSLGSVDVNDGIDMGAYPLCRTFTIGVKMNF